MLAMLGDGVGAIHGRITLGGQKISLTLHRPMLKAASLLAVKCPHFLQTHNIGIKLLNSMPEVVYFKAARGAKALNAFVNVVGRYAKSVHCLILLINSNVKPSIKFIYTVDLH